MPEKCTNASLPPSSGVMNPKPFSSENHLTTPVATYNSSSRLCFERCARWCCGTSLPALHRRRADAQVLPVLGGRPLARSGAAAGRGLGVGRLLRRGLVEARVKAAPAGAVVAVVLGSAAALAGAAAAGRVDPVADAALRLLAGLVAGVPAARARVVPEERRGDERLLGLRELAAELALDALHVLAPDLGRERAARHRAALEQRAHLDLGVGVADPHGAREARCEADEPGVGELVRGPGLAGRRAADLRAGAGALLDVFLEDLGRLVGDAV